MSLVLECVSKREIRKFEQILCQFKEETRRLSSAKSRVDDAEMAQKMPKLQIKEFLRHTLKSDAIISHSALCKKQEIVIYQFNARNVEYICLDNKNACSKKGGAARMQRRPVKGLSDNLCM